MTSSLLLQQIGFNLLWDAVWWGAVCFARTKHYLQKNYCMIIILYGFGQCHNQAGLKEVQAIDKGMLLTGVLVTGLCEIELGAFCLQRALGWSWAPTVGGHASRTLPQLMELRAATQNWVYKEMCLGSTTALLPQSLHKQESWSAGRRMMCPKLPWLAVGDVLDSHQEPWPTGWGKVFQDWSHPLPTSLGLLQIIWGDRWGNIRLNSVIIEAHSYLIKGKSAHPHVGCDWKEEGFSVCSYGFRLELGTVCFC